MSCYVQLEKIRVYIYIYIFMCKIKGALYIGGHTNSKRKPVDTTYIQTTNTSRRPQV
jgi:predicted GIY-YIG superfamily endonuclease